MNTWQILLESIAILLLIFGYAYEEKVVDFEQNVKRIVVGNYRHWKRNKKR